MLTRFVFNPDKISPMSLGPPPRMKQRPPTPPIGPPSNRPDVGFSRGRPTFNDATNMDSNFASISKPKKSYRLAFCYVQLSENHRPRRVQKVNNPPPKTFTTYKNL